MMRHHHICSLGLRGLLKASSIFCALLLATACTNDTDLGDVDSDMPICFTVENEKTRATDDEFTDFTGENFAVTAYWYADGDMTDEEPLPVMDNLKINYANGVATIENNNKYYWVKGGWHFAAYSPWVADQSTAPMKVTVPQGIYGGYTFNGKVTGRTDYMFADEQAGYYKMTATDGLQHFSGNAVPMRFRHALTKVQFRARLGNGTPSNVSLKINSMYVRNVRIKGSATFTHNGKSGYASVSPTDDANKWNTDDMKWTVSKEFPTGSTYDANYLGDHEVNCDGMSGIGTTFTVFNDCFYLMPQQLYTTGESEFVQTLEVNYTIVTNGSEGVTKEVSVPLKTSNIPAWTVNKAVMYNLVVETGEELSLTAAVQPWKKEEFTNEFSDIVTVNADGKIRWTPGTCTVIDENVVLDNNISNAAEFTFTIAGPLGGTWQAIFVTQEGNPTAFSLSQSEGEVGKPCTVRVSANQVNNTKTANVAELRFVVRCAGAILPVDELTTLPDGHNYKIVQNISLN